MPQRFPGCDKIDISATRCDNTPRLSESPPRARRRHARLQLAFYGPRSYTSITWYASHDGEGEPDVLRVIFAARCALRLMTCRSRVIFAAMNAVARVIARFLSQFISPCHRILWERLFIRADADKPREYIHMRLRYWDNCWRLRWWGYDFEFILATYV